MAEARKRPELAGVMTTALFGVPQVGVNVDNAKAMTQQIPLDALYQTVQTFMGGSLVNYFNRFGLQWQVYVQADGDFRTNASNLGKFYVRNANNQMVPLSTLTTTYPRSGAEFVMRYNLFNCVQINASAAPGYSSAQVIAALEDVFKQTMPPQMGYDWSGMSYQEVKAAQGVSPATIFGLAFFVVFLIMAAQYESWTLPFSVLLGVPIAIFGAFVALYFPQPGKQRLCADRTGHADRAFGEERNSHRGVRQGGIRQGHTSDGSLSHWRTSATSTHPDDRLRLHPGLRPAVDSKRRGSHLPAGAGNLRHRRHVGGDDARRFSSSRSASTWSSASVTGLAAARNDLTHRLPRRQRKERPMTRLKTSVAIVGVPLSLCACKVGPNYERPKLDVPGRLPRRGAGSTAAASDRAIARECDCLAAQAQPATPPLPTPPPAMENKAEQQPVATPAQPAQPQAGSAGCSRRNAQGAGNQFGDLPWTSVFQDDVLQGLIKEALTNNYDLRVAATRVLQANANLGIVRANQFPTLNGTGSANYGKDEVQFNNRDPQGFGTLGLSLNYVTDFWGQYRRATESARATLLATKYAQEVVQISLINSVVTDYYLMLQYDDQLEYSRKTVEADHEIYKLNDIKFKGGDAAITDVYQAEVILQQAEAGVITYQQLAEQAENNLSILLGRNPGPIRRGLNLVSQPVVPDIPEGLPSDLLKRRPDIRQAEENLVAANANVGVAKAAFFPQFSITGTLGTQSLSLSNFLSGPSLFWAVGRKRTAAHLPGWPYSQQLQVGVGTARSG